MKRWRLAGLLGCVAVTLAGSGCGAALSKDEELQVLAHENLVLQDRLVACERRVADLTAAGAQPKPAAAPAADPFRVAAIRFNKHTGVLEGGGPADERLKIILEPLDESGEIVKRAGSLELEALNPAPAGQPPKLVHRWQFPLADLAQTWTNMLSVTGYVLKLPWPEGRRPAGPGVIVRAKFTTLSGEALAAETQVTLPRLRGRPPAGPISANTLEGAAQRAFEECRAYEVAPGTPPEEAVRVYEENVIKVFPKTKATQEEKEGRRAPAVRLARKEDA